METHSLLEYPHLSGFRAPVAGAVAFGADSPAAPRQRPATVSQNWWPRTLHGQNFSSVQARSAAFARSLLAPVLRPSVPVIIQLTKFSKNLREHEFGNWLHSARRPADYLGALRVRRPSPCLGGESPKPSVRRWSPSHPTSLPDTQAPLERHVRLSPTGVYGTGHTGAQRFPNVAKKWLETSVQRKHAGDTNMQNWECMLACPSAGKNARLPTNVVQSDEAENPCSHSCSSKTTAGMVGLETQTSSQHQILLHLRRETPDRLR